MSSGERGWMRHGACLHTPGLPWTSDTDHVPTVLVEEMTATCEACPARLACAAHVAASLVTGGFWAGADRDPVIVRQAVNQAAAAGAGGGPRWDRAEWVPQRTSRGRDAGEQGTLPLDGLAGLDGLDGLDGVA